MLRRGLVTSRESALSRCLELRCLEKGICHVEKCKARMRAVWVGLTSQVRDLGAEPTRCAGREEHAADCGCRRAAIPNQYIVKTAD